MPAPPDRSPVRLYVAARRVFKRWWALGASLRALKTILRGVQISWTQVPPCYRSKGYRLAPADEDWAKGELERWLPAGYLRELSAEEAATAHCVMGGLVTHSAGRPRLVIDYRHVNAFTEKWRFNYET